MWSIAKKFNTTVASIKGLNNLHSSSINAGKVLSIKKNSK
ncbi:MAG: LysM peptidoglycan-binding domain-containing protein [Mucispirillum sp.]|nr:LysM peptidoglycan-binding domain-containing protein [Mucispirillum sp.]